MKIEAGKAYKTREGVRSFLWFKNEEHKDFPFQGHVDETLANTPFCASWTQNGRFSCDGSESPYDLVEEWPEEKTEGSTMTNDDFAQEVCFECDRIREMLIEKNIAYGNSALEPVRAFSKSNSVEQLRVRIDDKISRIARGKDVAGEDTIDDLIGYLILLKIANKRS